MAAGIPGPEGGRDIDPGPVPPKKRRDRPGHPRVPKRSHFWTSPLLGNLPLWYSAHLRAAAAFLLNNQIRATLCES